MTVTTFATGPRIAFDVVRAATAPHPGDRSEALVDLMAVLGRPGLRPDAPELTDIAATMVATGEPAGCRDVLRALRPLFPGDREAVLAAVEAQFDDAAAVLRRRGEDQSAAALATAGARPLSAGRRAVRLVAEYQSQERRRGVPATVRGFTRHVAHRWGVGGPRHLPGYAVRRIGAALRSRIGLRRRLP